MLECERVRGFLETWNGCAVVLQIVYSLKYCKLGAVNDTRTECQDIVFVAECVEDMKNPNVYITNLTTP